MTAKGKINASSVTTGDRIIVRPVDSNLERTDTIRPSDTKTGEGVHIARVIGKTFRAAQGPYEARGKYVIETTSGTFEAAPIQTMWLAPEDVAGVKRAYTEALAEDRERELVAHEAVEANQEEPRREDMDDLPDPDGSNTLPIPAGPWFDPEAGASAPDANRHASQTDGVQALTLHSQACKVSPISSEDNEQMGPAAMTNTTTFFHQPTDETPAATAVRPTYGSDVIRALENAWHFLMSLHPELPDVIVVTGVGMEGW